MLTISKKLFIPLLLVVLIVGFAGGLFFERFNGVESNPVKILLNKDLGQPDYVDFSLFWDNWNSLHNKYVDQEKLDTKKLLYGAIQGMVNSVGDPYTVFFEPPESKKFQEEISGSFGGVGIEIGKRNSVLTVIAPIKDTPAFKAGIQAGDKIIKIDGKSTLDMSIEEAVTLIRGKPGTKVVLTIQNGTTRDVEIIRAVIKAPTIDWKLIEQGTDKIAYMRIYSFNQIVDSEFKKASEEILQSGANGLIIDLRNNPGGLLDSAINLAGWFLDRNKVVVIELFGDGTRNEFRSDGNSSLKKYPTIILMNGG